MRRVSSIAVDSAHRAGTLLSTFWMLAAIGTSSVLGASPAVVAEVDSEEAAAVRAIPASVSTVVDGGLWGERGSYRVVVTQGGFEHIHSEVYAQWISTNDKGEARVDESVRVKELSNLVGAVIGDVRMALASKESRAVFEIDVVDRESQKKRMALLHMGKRGELSVELPPREFVE